MGIIFICKQCGKKRGCNWDPEGYPDGIYQSCKKCRLGRILCQPEIDFKQEIAGGCGCV